MRDVITCCAFGGLFATTLASPLAGQWDGPPALAWSPDGRHLLFEPRGLTVGAACFDRATGRSQLLLSGDWCVRRSPLAFAWTADGRTAVVAAHLQPRPSTLHVHRIAVVGDGAGTAAARRSFTVQLPADRPCHAPLSMVVRGDSLFLAASDLLRIDLRTGDVTARTRAPDGLHFRVLPGGNGIAYATGPDALASGHVRWEWEVGMVDAATLATTPLWRAGSPKHGFTAVPAFAPDGAGFAVATGGLGPEACDLRLLRGDVLLTTLAVLPPMDTNGINGQTLGNVAWSHDGLTMWVGSERYDGASHWSLWRIRSDDSGAHEIPVGGGGRTRCIGPCDEPAIVLSPDGAQLAFDARQLQACLVDAATGTCAVVPDPEPTPVVVHGPAEFAALVAKWQADLTHLPLQLTHRAEPGTAAIAALHSGACDLVVTADCSAAADERIRTDSPEFTRTAIGARIVWLPLTRPRTPILCPLWLLTAQRCAPVVEGFVQYVRRFGDRAALQQAGYWRLPAK